MDSDNADLEYDRAARIQAAITGAAVQRLADNLGRVATMYFVSKMQYMKGFDDGRLLKEFCDEYVPEPYYPMGDSRPAAQRLSWSKT